MKPICRILWAENLLMSDLTFGLSFKVKRWFTGFGELSFQWIQICIGSPMHGSSLTVELTVAEKLYNVLLYIYGTSSSIINETIRALGGELSAKFLQNMLLILFAWH